MRAVDARGRALLALFLVGSVGALAELLLLEHVEEAFQWAPVTLLTVGSVAAGSLLLAPRLPPARRIWTPLMALYVAAGPIGVYLHVRSNLAFELELDAPLTGFALWRETLMGATPSLAPGTMTLLGLLGWLALRPPGVPSGPGGSGSGVD